MEVALNGMESAENIRSMKHCRSCDYCEIDLISQYVKGIDFHKCVLSGEHIERPFWDGRKCKLYKKRRRRELLKDKHNFIYGG